MRAATGTSVDLTKPEFDVLRKLLEDQQTWNVAGRGTVEDLATRIADCLPPRDGRTAEDSHAAALTIARGLIEFAVADLDPKLFQQVLMARLQRMETGQASALDEALLGLHARFASLMDQLKLALDRLPPGPAGRGEIAVYHQTAGRRTDGTPGRAATGCPASAGRPGRPRRRTPRSPTITSPAARDAARRPPRQIPGAGQAATSRETGAGPQEDLPRKVDYFMGHRGSRIVAASACNLQGSMEVNLQRYVAQGRALRLRSCSGERLIRI